MNARSRPWSQAGATRSDRTTRAGATRCAACSSPRRATTSNRSCSTVARRATPRAASTASSATPRSCSSAARTRREPRCATAGAPMTGLAIPDADLARLPAIAIDAIAHTLRTGRRVLPDPAELPPALAHAGASFVTLERDERLLGCIGTLTADRPLGVSVAHGAIAAAFDDPRLPPLSAEDYCAMQVKVSVLSEPQPIAARSLAAFATTLHAGVDGVVVARKRQQATFLPSVWEQLPDRRDFL